jgi:HAD superfamily hydrolase (TIGR01509 family)
VLAAFVAGVRSRYKVAVLSNAGPDLREAMVRKFDLESLVDLMVVSAEEGVQKPDAAIYLLTADRLGVSPAECLFVDDQERNVAGARAVGMLAVLHESPETTVAVIRQLLTTVEQTTKGPG